MSGKLFKLIFLFSIFCFFLPISSYVYARDYKVDYQVEYFLSQSENNLHTNVKFNISITNLRSDIYVNKFAIVFPKSFIIHNLKVSDDYGLITPQITTDDERTKIEMEFSRPNIGRGTINNFYLQFFQENLFQINGNIWEVILPTVEGRKDSNYKVVVNLPSESGKKISLAKPKPDLISGNQIIWNNPQTKTIYAIFGDNQIYQTQLFYHLKNPKLVQIYTDIALPPDTLYQKIYFQKIEPKPNLTFRDEDGNLLARYLLKPAEKKSIIFEGVIKIFVKPREEVIPIIRSDFNNQKKYLLSQQKYWQIDNLEKIENLSSVSEIYNFVVRNLKYDYQRLNKPVKRLGANEILRQPNQAVCLEFTDLFVAIAREKGIYAREIQGYAFSQDPQIRPLSLVSDILHSWPEFYDEKLQLWLPIDPTWENTSGIDYFSSFDLNHIVFVIHGKKPDYPVPAGMYKIEDSQDILIKVASSAPTEIIKLESKFIDFPKMIIDNRLYKGKLILENKGNVYLWNIPIKTKTKNLNLYLDDKIIPVLAPLEKKEIDFTYQAKIKNRKESGLIDLFVNNNLTANYSLTIIPYYYNLSLKITAIIVGILLIFFLFKFFKSR